MREFMESGDGRVLVFNCPERQGDSVGPIFSYLIDEALFRRR